MSNRQEQRIDEIGSFLQDIICLDGTEYKRKDIEQILSDTGYHTKPHPFDHTLETIEINKDTTVNNIDCSRALLEFKDGEIQTVIMYPYYIAPLVAACSIKSKPDMYSTPLGTLCDYYYDPAHKITVGPDGSFIYLWT